MAQMVSAADFGIGDRRSACGISRKGPQPQPTQLAAQADAWSIGQCLEHLRVGNEVVLPEISAALEGRPPRNTADEITLGWFARYFIRTYIAANPGGKRAKAPLKIQPASQVDPTVLEAFLRSMEAVRTVVSHARHYDVNRIRYKNPFIPGLRFTVGAGLEILAKHPGRHLLQAEGVKQSVDFPR
jgi:hypothetical protein